MAAMGSGPKSISLVMGSKLDPSDHSLTRDFFMSNFKTGLPPFNSERFAMPAKMFHKEDSDDEEHSGDDDDDEDIKWDDADKAAAAKEVRKNIRKSAHGAEKKVRWVMQDRDNSNAWHGTDKFQKDNLAMVTINESTGQASLVFLDGSYEFTKEYRKHTAGGRVLGVDMREDARRMEGARRARAATGFAKERTEPVSESPASSVSSSRKSIFAKIGSKMGTLKSKKLPKPRRGLDEDEFDARELMGDHENLDDEAGGHRSNDDVELGAKKKGGGGAGSGDEPRSSDDQEQRQFRNFSEAAEQKRAKKRKGKGSSAGYHDSDDSDSETDDDLGKKSPGPTQSSGAGTEGDGSRGQKRGRGSEASAAAGKGGAKKAKTFTLDKRAESPAAKEQRRKLKKEKKEKKRKERDAKKEAAKKAKTPKHYPITIRGLTAFVRESPPISSREMILKIKAMHGTIDGAAKATMREFMGTCLDKKKTKANKALTLLDEYLPVVWVTTGSVGKRHNVRARPATSSRRIGRISPKDQITVHTTYDAPDSNQTWVQVDMGELTGSTSHAGITGWLLAHDRNSSVTYLKQVPVKQRPSRATTPATTTPPTVAPTMAAPAAQPSRSRNRRHSSGARKVRAARKGPREAEAPKPPGEPPRAPKAAAISGPHAELAGQLVGMGFPARDAMAALGRSGGDIAAAIEALLTSAQ